MPILFFIDYGFEIFFCLLILQTQEYANKDIKGDKSDADDNLTERNSKHQRYNRHDNRSI